MSESGRYLILPALGSEGPAPFAGHAPGRSEESAVLVGFDPLDLPVFGGVTVGLTVISLLACYIPVRRAMAVDPAVTLKYESRSAGADAIFRLFPFLFEANAFAGDLGAKLLDFGEISFGHGGSQFLF